MLSVSSFRVVPLRRIRIKQIHLHESDESLTSGIKVEWERQKKKEEKKRKTIKIETSPWNTRN